MSNDFNPEFASPAASALSALALIGLFAALFLLIAIGTTYRTLPATAPAPARLLRATLMVTVGGPIRFHQRRMAVVRRDQILTSGTVYRITPTQRLLHLMDEKAS